MARQVIRSAHERGHFSTAKTAAIVNRDYWIPDAKAIMQKIVKNCITCILAKRKWEKWKVRLKLPQQRSLWNRGRVRKRPLAMKSMTFEDECNTGWPSVGMCVCKRMCVCERIDVCKQSFAFEKTREHQSRKREAKECRAMCVQNVRSFNNFIIKNENHINWYKILFPTLLINKL